MHCRTPGMIGIALIHKSQLSVGLKQETKARDTVPQNGPAKNIQENDFQNDLCLLQRKSPARNDGAFRNLSTEGYFRIERPAYSATSPKTSSIRISWLYFASRSERASEPVLI